METIFDFIRDDILSDIEKIGFDVEAVPLNQVHAVTYSDAGIVVYNSETCCLYELAEELHHARLGHHRQWAGYDIRNHDEKEAHQASLEYLIDRWLYYGGSQNWLTFITVTGTPGDAEQVIIDAFRTNGGSLATY
ncbi:hypothetical protein [Pediococcus pentosaceus]|uniref:hypothetical protein n=1 Tax=Pediococcus pentosaceus TaxID=1255 RepID=UPI003981EAE9